MSYELLKITLAQLIVGNSTLLWLEGSKTEQVLSVKVQPERLILSLVNGTTKLIKFEKYAVTKVGLQFWNKGRAGVLYRWDIGALKSVDSKCSSEVSASETDNLPHSVA